MADPRDPLAAFDDAVVEAAADDLARSPAALRELVRRHQELVRETPGVADLLYEWRRYYPDDPLVARTDRAAVVLLHDRVWSEFTDRLALDERDRRALLAVHERQARAEVGDDALTDGAPMVLTRP
ncbi:MAG: hypothetical protein ABEJ23_04740 [Haloarculaceae archaeon]